MPQFFEQKIKLSNCKISRSLLRRNKYSVIRTVFWWGTELRCDIFWKYGVRKIILYRTVPNPLTHCCQLVIAFLSLWEFLQKLFLLWCHKIAKCKVCNGTELNGLNCIFANMGNCGKSLGHLFITSSSSYFFNKNDFEQYFYNNSSRGIFVI